LATWGMNVTRRRRKARPPMRFTWRFSRRWRSRAISAASGAPKHRERLLCTPSLLPHSDCFDAMNRTNRDLGGRPDPRNTITARTEGYTYAAKVWPLCLVQGPFSVALCQARRYAARHARTTYPCVLVCGVASDSPWCVVCRRSRESEAVDGSGAETQQGSEETSGEGSGSESNEESDGEGSGGESAPTPRVSATYTGAFRV
jgi:hypothetical protein